jgi:NAD(P)H-dependent flavin oxidoreductase YrpB (nitropropane dioxygenase family)
VAELGVSAVIAQGGEGGGHTGPVPTTLLLPAVVDALDGTGIPVIAAGGFYDGRGLIAARAYGADGIAMGTRFLLTAESHVPDHVKAVYLGTPPTGTVVTSAIDGAPQRVINTEFIASLESASPLTRFPKAAMNALRYRKKAGVPLPTLIRTAMAMRRDQELSWAQVALAANAPMLTAESMVHGRLEAGILPTGQVTGSIDAIPTVAELLDSIAAEATDTLRRLGSAA